MGAAEREREAKARRAEEVASWPARGKCPQCGATVVRDPDTGRLWCYNSPRRHDTTGVVLT